MNRLLWVLSVALALPLVHTPALAQPAERAAERLPLPTFTRRELEMIRPQLERGPVLLALFRNRREDAPPVVMAARIEATPDEVAALVMRPEGYTDYMPALSSVEIETRNRDQLAYSWTWHLGIFTLAGHNFMTIYRGNERRGYRIDVTSTGGDLGHGRLSWRIRPDGPNHSIVTLASRIDMRDANYLAEQIAVGGTSVFRSINICLSTVMLLATQREAEGREREVGTSPMPPVEPLEIDHEFLTPLIHRGDLVFLELDQERMRRVAVLGRTTRQRETTRAVMTSPEEFGRSLMVGSRAEVVEVTEDHTDFEWEIPIPLISVEGRMRIFPSEDVIRVEGVEGSLASGRWGFDTLVWEGSQEAAVVGWGRFDPRESARLIRRIIDDDTDFSHGLAVATQVMVIRALRTRIMRYQRP